MLTFTLQYPGEVAGRSANFFTSQVIRAIARSGRIPRIPSRAMISPRFGPVWTQPTVQKPHPPIWIGGNGTAARRRVLEHASGWMPLIITSVVASTIGMQALTDIAEFGSAAGALKTRLEAAGRDLAASLDYIDAFAAAFINRSN